MQTRRLQTRGRTDRDPGQPESGAKAPNEVGAARGTGFRFALKYALFAGAGFVVYGFPYAERGIVEHAFEAYLAAYARVAGGVLGLFEPELQVVGTELLGRFPLQIAKNCDAIEANILLAAALLAFPAPLLRRMVALTIGVVLLAVLNVLRISSLYFVGVHARSWFDFAHLELWPLLLIGVAAVEFLLLARWMQSPKAELPSDPRRPGLAQALDGVLGRARALFDSVRRRKWHGRPGV